MGTYMSLIVSGQVVGASPDSLNALNQGAKVWIPLVGLQLDDLSLQFLGG